MHVIAHGGCTVTEPESALEVVCGRQFLAAPGTRTRVSLMPGFSVGLLYPLSFSRSSNQGLFHACESGCIVIVNQSSGRRPISLSVSLSVCLFLSLSVSFYPSQLLNRAYNICLWYCRVYLWCNIARTVFFPDWFKWT